MRRDARFATPPASPASRLALQSTNARSRYDTLSKPHEVRRRVLAEPSIWSGASRRCRCDRRRPAKTWTWTTCAHWRTPRVRLPLTRSAGSAAAEDPLAAGAYRFVYPCRCGDSFVVAEAVRSCQPPAVCAAVCALNPRRVAELAGRRLQCGGPVRVRLACSPAPQTCIEAARSPLAARAPRASRSSTRPPSLCQKATACACRQTRQQAAAGPSQLCLEEQTLAS